MEGDTPSSRRSLGTSYESLAAAHLESLGYEILERNYHGRYGEIDLIAREGDVLVFVEVRMRRRDSLAEPLETVTPKKQRAIWTAAERYLAEREIQDVDVRFDVLGIRPGEGGAEYHLIRNAIEGGEGLGW